MRPGRFAPDNKYNSGYAAWVRRASMRPGRFAPDNSGARCNKKIHRPASMRPGRFAPDNDPALSGNQENDYGFNEAGAVCPG